MRRNKIEPRICDPEVRFIWITPSDLPERVELIDRVTSRRAAVILTLNHRFLWRREKTAMMHITSPPEGIADSLTDAKAGILTGLKNEM